MELRFSLGECEHYGDVDFHIENIEKSGGKVLDKHLDFDSETAWFRVEVESKEKFVEEFKKTDSWDL